MNNELQWPSHLVQSFVNTYLIGELQYEIMDMATESFNGLINGEYRSSVIIAGEATHRLNCALLAAYIAINGSSDHTKLNNMKLDDYDEHEIANLLVHNLKFHNSSKMLKDLNLTNDDLFQNMTLLRHLRNKATHSWKPNVFFHDLTLDELGITIEDVFHTPMRLEPLSWIRYQTIIKINNNYITFIINPEKLMIDLRGVDYKKHVPIISLAILFSSMKNMLGQLKRLYIQR